MDGAVPVSFDIFKNYLSNSARLAGSRPRACCIDTSTLCTRLVITQPTTLLWNGGIKDKKNEP